MSIVKRNKKLETQAINRAKAALKRHGISESEFKKHGLPKGVTAKSLLK